MGTWFVLAVVILIVFLAIRSLYRDKKSGKVCSGCSGCSGSCCGDTREPESDCCCGNAGFERKS